MIGGSVFSGIGVLLLIASFATCQDADYTGTAYCAYQDDWGTSNAVITYDRLTVEKNTVPGAMLSTTTGEFTAGASGLYNVMASMTMVSADRDNYLFFRLNNENLKESRMNSFNWQQHFEMGGRSMMIEMSKGDTLSLYAAQLYQLRGDAQIQKPKIRSCAPVVPCSMFNNDHSH